jgi:hypothetical protein
MEVHHAAGMGSVILPIVICFLILFTLAATAFWIWMLVSAIQNKGLEDTEKIVWIIVIALTHWVGALIYFFIGHPKRLLAQGPPPRSV